MKHATLLLGLFLFLWVRPAGAVKVFEDKDKGIVVNVGVFVQPTLQMTTPGPGAAGEGPCGPATRGCSPNIGNPEGNGPSFDMFLRRARLMLWGNATKELSFFIDTDQTNWGKYGNFTTSMIVQDAFFSYAFIPEFKIDAGLMLVPFSHHTLEGATSLNALDYHSDLIRLPAGTAFRDVGVQFRGLVANDIIHYRVGIFNGVRNAAVPAQPVPAPPAPPPPARSPLNNLGLPRVTAQVRANLMGTEPDFFLKGIYFSPTPIISIGVGADFQPNAVYKPSGRSNYFAMSGDAFIEYPFSADDEIIFKANVFYYAPGNTTIPGSSALFTGGIAAYAEVGFRHAWIEPVAFIEYLKAKNDALSILSPHVGVNFWAIKHTFNVKTDLGYKVQEFASPRPATRDILWTTQGQVFF